MLKDKYFISPLKTRGAKELFDGQKTQHQTNIPLKEINNINKNICQKSSTLPSFQQTQKLNKQIGESYGFTNPLNKMSEHCPIRDHLLKKCVNETSSHTPSSLESFDHSLQSNLIESSGLQSPLQSKSSSQSDIYLQTQNITFKQNVFPGSCLKHSLSQGTINSQQPQKDFQSLCKNRYQEFLKSQVQSKKQEINTCSYVQSGSTFTQISNKNKEQNEIRKRSSSQSKNNDEKKSSYMHIERSDC